MKKFKIIVFISFAVILLTTSCKPKPIKIDSTFSRDSIIDVSVLETIMYDIFLAEAAIYKVQMEGGDVNFKSQLYYNSIFTKYKIDRNQILGSITYYITSQEIEGIYRNVISKLRKLESSIEYEHENDSTLNIENQN